MEPTDHRVQIYEHDDDLMSEVISFVETGLRFDEAVVVLATKDHRDALDAGLAGSGLDPDYARASGRLVCLDAAEVLETITDGSTVRPEAFMAVVGSLVARAGRDARPVRAFGEMVALLWDRGQVDAALELESLWGVLVEDRKLALHCAYPLTSLAGGADLGAVKAVCAHHSEVFPPHSYLGRESPTAVPDGPVGGWHLFVPAASAVPAVRHFVADVLSQWGLVDLTDAAALVVTELATNALRHARSPFRVAVGRSSSGVRIAVHDASRQRPRLGDPGLTATGGRGVWLVDEVSSRWGTDDVADGKVVWSELDTQAS